MQAENIFFHQSMPARSFKLKIETLLIFVPVQITLNLILNFLKVPEWNYGRKFFGYESSHWTLKQKNTRTSNVLYNTTQGHLVLSCLKKDEAKV